MNQVVNLILCMYGVLCDEEIDKENQNTRFTYMIRTCTMYTYGV